MAPIIRISDEDYQALRPLGFRPELVEEKPVEIITPASDFWAVPNIHYRGDTLTADLSKKLLPARTQQHHTEHRKSAQEGEFVTADMPFYFAMFYALFEQKDAFEYSGQARNFIQRAIRQKFPITLTRIAYTPRGKDVVTNNYGTKDSYQTRANIVGPDRFIEKANNGALTAILGTGDIARINQVFNWINGTDLSIYRLKDKPQDLKEAVARFVAYPDSARVSCIRHHDDAGASLGVRVSARSAQKK